MAGDWRLICPECGVRTFHDVDGDDNAECRRCGDSDPIEVRKGNSRNEDPNPDRTQPTLQQFADVDGEEGR